MLENDLKILEDDLLNMFVQKLNEIRVGIRQNIYTSCFFRTQKFTPKVRDSRQIQCYQKCVIRDKFNTKKNKKHPLC